MRALGGALIGLPAAGFVFVLRACLPDQPMIAGEVFVLILLFVAFGTQIFSARWRVDDEGIEDLTPLRRRTRIAWEDVAWMRRAFSNVLIAGRSGRNLAVPVWLAGFDEFRRLVLAHVPASSISDNMRYTLRPQDRVVPEWSISGDPRYASPPERHASSRSIPVDAPEPILVPQDAPAARWRDNPFFLLGLEPECSRAEVERTGQKLLALLAVNSSAAKKAKTPLGEVERTADLVRAAMAELRDPEKRFGHEAWARLPVDAPLPADAGGPSKATKAWNGAMSAIGWRIR
jgi:hypothetical protein